MALAIYKNKPALVKEKAADKILIVLSDGAQAKVREKDIEIIYPGPVSNFDGINERGATCDNAARETWELLLSDGGAETAVSLKDLAELAFGEYTPISAWDTYCLLLDGLYFSGTSVAIYPRQKDQVEADEKKREEKQRASGERELFLERLRKRTLLNDGTSLDDRRFIQDVEALALGKSGKSRTMKDIGLGETPEEAHALLLECGFWTEQVNPYPSRFGVSASSAGCNPEPPPEEPRRDLTHLPAFAIDSPWSHDPDDAISLETDDGRHILYVHVADPAASITVDSPPEKEARDRGATLYLPEGSSRMLAEECLPIFALGLAETSPALTFKMTLNDDGEIAETEIFPSTVKVSRLTYKDADGCVDNSADAEAAVLRELYALAERNLNRRLAAGAINIDLPEVHIGVDQGQVSIEPIVPFRSADMVRECMLLAGEGAGLWAIQHNVPFPYIEQETGDIPNEVLPGLAGSYQLRRCMRPRVLSVKPGRHWGLGLDTYTQVTSPLRRYTDLLAHMQIRAFLREEGDRENGLTAEGGELPPSVMAVPLPMAHDELAGRMSAGEAASAAVTQAERASRTHWIMVYLSGKKDSVWDAVALEKKGSRWVVTIPALALETQVPLRREIAPNDTIRLVLKSVNIPRGEAIFIAEE